VVAYPKPYATIHSRWQSLTFRAKALIAAGGCSGFTLCLLRPCVLPSSEGRGENVASAGAFVAKLVGAITFFSVVYSLTLRKLTLTISDIFELY
jgi:hypothetical protein